ncbi:MAG: hypothetical protein KME26_26835 [Oscillatoria princeps RMCB-10]|nr:hypothetical protein [Oscillatoria princeps RMCB-10]
MPVLRLKPCGVRSLKAAPTPVGGSQRRTHPTCAQIHLTGAGSLTTGGGASVVAGVPVPAAGCENAAPTG